MMNYDTNLEQLSNFIPDTETVDLLKVKEKVIDPKEFTVEDTSGLAFALNPIYIGKRSSISKEPLTFEKDVNLVYRDVISIGTASRGGFELYANFFAIRDSLIKALCKYTNHDNVSIRWERPGLDNKFRLLDNVNAFEIRAYITKG